MKTLQERINESVGKTLTIEKGLHETGPLSIPSHTHIIFEEGAELSFSDDFSAYPPVLTRWEGVECYAMHPLIFINEAEDVTIEGDGIINGNGKKWWDYIMLRRHDQKAPETDVEKRFAALNPGYMDEPGGGGGRQTQFLRPPLVQIRHSRQVTIKNCTLTQSPFWTLHPLLSEDLVFDDLKIINPYVTPNTDGIDLESCAHVVIKNCTVDVGDDGICLKSGSGDDGIKAAKPTFDVTITGCIVRQAHGGIVIGSETAAGVHDVTVSDCFFDHTDRGIRLKTRRGRGGHIHHITISHIQMKDTICPIVFNMFYRCGNDDPVLYSLEKQTITYATPKIDHVTISHCLAEGSRVAAGFIAGLPEMPISDLTITDCTLLVSPEREEGAESAMASGIPDTDFRGLRMLFAEDVKLENIKVNTNPMVMRS